jgi:5-methylcytosine-specific restriction protein A
MRKPNIYRSKEHGARWKRESKAFLRLHPWCRMCAKLGIRTSATLVDHCEPHRGNLALFWNRTNWQPACAHCHSGPKQSIERGGVPKYGCDERGNPLDPSHHWHNARPVGTQGG